MVGATVIMNVKAICVREGIQRLVVRVSEKKMEVIVILILSVYLTCVYVGNVVRMDRFPSMRVAMKVSNAKVEGARKTKINNVALVKRS